MYIPDNIPESEVIEYIKREQAAEQYKNKSNAIQDRIDERVKALEKHLNEKYRKAIWNKKGSENLSIFYYTKGIVEQLITLSLAKVDLDREWEQSEYYSIIKRTKV